MPSSGRQVSDLPNYEITQSQKLRIGTHGQYIYSQQRRSQEGEAHGTQEARDRESIEGPRGSKKQKVKKLARGQAKR
jgi:hypothetical protein